MLTRRQTPRAARASADSQTWEFAHSKFLRGRPDLLDEIRRKALEPDPSIKQRVELPGELAAQLSSIREENRRVVRALDEERNRNQRLANMLKILYDVVAKTHPVERGYFLDFLVNEGLMDPPLPLSSLDVFDIVPIPFPTDLLEQPDMPPIYITSPINNSPSHSHYGASGDAMYQIHGMSPSSSPTAGEFPSHIHSHPHSHSSSGGTQRGLSLPHIVTGSYDSSGTGNIHSGGGRYSTMPNRGYGEGAPSSPSPINTPISGPEDDGGLGFRAKRQRTTPSPGVHDMGMAGVVGGVGVGVGLGISNVGVGSNMNVRRLGARARSDSAPLGQGLGQGGHGGHGQLNPPAPGWPQGRPRSGSGVGPGVGLGGGGGAGGLGMSFSPAVFGNGTGLPTLTVPNLPPMLAKEDGMVGDL